MRGSEAVPGSGAGLVRASGATSKPGVADRGEARLTGVTCSWNGQFRELTASDRAPRMLKPSVSTGFSPPAKLTRIRFRWRKRPECPSSPDNSYSIIA